MSLKKSSYAFLNPQSFMKHDIENISKRIHIEAIEITSSKASEMQQIVSYCRNKNIKSVVALAQEDVLCQIIINKKLGNYVPTKIAFLYCMNKYLMRTLEDNPFYFDAIDPINESNDTIIEKIKEWPFMLKNTSFSRGFGIYKINNKEELQEILDSYRKDKKLQELISFQNNSYIKNILPSELPKKIPPFIAEHLVDINNAIEYCYEGYVTKSGEIIHYALTEEIFFSDHTILGYVTPPVSISNKMAEKIETWVNNYMEKMVKLGYCNQFFNLEFWIMPDNSIIFTEINPRMAHIYHYNYLYSFGNSLYEDNFKLVADEEICNQTPWKKWREGNDFKYTLIILITTKETGVISDIIDYDYVDHLEKNKNLLISHNKQHNYKIEEKDMSITDIMIMKIWITANNREEIIAKEHKIRKKIYKKIQLNAKYPKYWE